MGDVKPAPGNKDWTTRLWAGLIRAVDIFDQLRVPYVLDGGTLLGFIRDGYFFDHDRDADITLLDELAGLEQFQERAQNAGFKLAQPFNVKPDGSAKVQVRWDRGLIDVVSKHKVGADAIWVLRKDPTTIKRMPAHYYENRKRIIVRDYSFSVPEDAEGYLSARFGSDWRTPKPDWVALRDDLAYRSQP